MGRGNATQKYLAIQHNSDILCGKRSQTSTAAKEVLLNEAQMNKLKTRRVRGNKSNVAGIKMPINRSNSEFSKFLSNFSQEADLDPGVWNLFAKSA